MLVAFSFVVIPLLIMTRPHGVGTLTRHTLVPGVQGGWSADAVLLLVAIVGTAIAPWQLFFQQSNVIDMRITPRWTGYERADTSIGAIVPNTAAAAMMIFTAFALAATVYAGTTRTRAASPTRSPTPSAMRRARSCLSCWSTRPSSAPAR